MALEKKLDNILDSRSKIKIIRFFISRGDGFMASGSDVARAVGFTPPAVHASLKELFDQGILHRDIVGKQHIYRLNNSSHIVNEILKPAFQRELFIKNDIKNFLLKKIKEYGIASAIRSLILYGSLARGETHRTSDCDVAVVVNDPRAIKKIDSLFTEKISPEFSGYFGISLDVYIKTYDEFLKRLKRRLPPINDLMKSYVVVHGKDPIDYK